MRTFCPFCSKPVDYILKKKAVKEFKVNQVILAGGVSANSYLREQMKIEMEKLGVNINIPPSIELNISLLIINLDL